MSFPGPINESNPQTSITVGGVYNSIAPTPTSGQAVAFQTDIAGNLLVNVAAGGGGGGSNASVGATGSNVPSSATYVGADNPGGKLQGLAVDASGNLLVNVAAGSTGNAAAGATGSTVPSSASYTGFNSGGNLIGVSSANPFPVSQQGTVTVSGSVSVSNFPGTQPVSGTVTVQQTTGSNLHADIDNFPVTQVVSWSGQSVSVSNFPATQPISGTVTANAGTGTFTVGGTVSATQGTSPWVDNISQFGGNNVVTGVGNSGAGIPRVTVSSDSVISSITGSVTVSQATAANLQATVVGTGTFAVQASQVGAPWADNVTQFGGTNISTGTGVSGAGIPRVTVSSDSFPATQAITAISLPLPANAAQETGGNLASIASYDANLQQIVETLKSIDTTLKAMLVWQSVVFGSPNESIDLDTSASTFSS